MVGQIDSDRSPKNPVLVENPGSSRRHSLRLFRVSPGSFVVAKISCTSHRMASGLGLNHRRWIEPKNPPYVTVCHGQVTCCMISVM